MFFLLFLIPIFIAAGIDLVRYRHGELSRRGLWGCLAIDILPIYPLLFHTLVDNTPIVTRITMWVVWGWVVLTVPRFANYLLTWLGGHRLGRVVAWLLVALLLMGVIYGRRALRVTEVKVCSSRLPALFDGYRIVQFSDLHLGTLVNTRSEVGELVARINALQPDLVCFTGDLVNIRHSELDATATQLLQQIEAPVVSVLGNHDIGSYIRDTIHLPPVVSQARLMEQQRAMGWQLLCDSTIYLCRGDDSLSLTGISFDGALRESRHDRELPFAGGERAYRGVPPSLYNITLVHLPQHWEQILAAGYGDVTLSGHTHAMQLKVGCCGQRGWSPAAWLYDRWSGRYDLDGRTLYINDGIGYVGYPMRIGAWPEITLITLKRCE